MQKLLLPLQGTTTAVGRLSLWLRIFVEDEDEDEDGFSVLKNIGALQVSPWEMGRLPKIILIGRQEATIMDHDRWWWLSMLNHMGYQHPNIYIYILYACLLLCRFSWIVRVPTNRQWSKRKTRCGVSALASEWVLNRRARLLITSHSVSESHW